MNTSQNESPAENTAADALLTASDITVDFAGRDGKTMRVLDRVSLHLQRGETLGIVGESGCGKSMTALALMGLLPDAAALSGGSIQIAGRELVGLDAESMRALRGREISMIFQEPMSSLNPVFTVGEQIAESVRLHEKASAKAAMARAVEMLRAVDIPEAAVRARAYPHQLSGGMRQRVMIAMALVCRPRILLADEPTTALDTTVQAQIFDLLQALQDDTGTAIILITHDMGAVAELARRVAVMYAGRVVERGTVRRVLTAPRHPYTRGLIACIPHLNTAAADDAAPRRELLEIPGVVPALAEARVGCAFAPRCGEAMRRCEAETPVMRAAADGHAVACWAAGDCRP